MSIIYNIDHFDKNPNHRIIVSENTSDTSNLSIALYGKNTPNYGERLEENMIHIMECFASRKAPKHPHPGQLWFDRERSDADGTLYTGHLKVFNSRKYQVSNCSLFPNSINPTHWRIDIPGITPEDFYQHIILNPDLELFTNSAPPNSFFDDPDFPSGSYETTYEMKLLFPYNQAMTIYGGGIVAYAPISTLPTYPSLSPSLIIGWHIGGWEYILQNNTPLMSNFNAGNYRIYNLGTPLNANEAANKGYVDSVVTGSVSGYYDIPTANATFVAKAGSTMTGFLTLNANPTSSLHAATKGYVDSSITTHATNASLHLTTTDRNFLTGIVTTVTTTEVNYLSGVSSNIQSQINSRLSLSGGAMTGLLTLSADPTSGFHAATKQYVDNAVVGGYTSHTTDFTLHLTSAQNTLLDGISGVTSTNINSLSGNTANIASQFTNITNQLTSINTAIINKLSLTGGNMSGNIAMVGNAINTLKETNISTDAATNNKVLMMAYLGW